MDGEYPCNKCRTINKEEELVIVLTPGLQHYGRVNCPCGSFIRWLPKPDQDKSKRPSKHRNLVKKIGVECCQICLREKRELPPRQTLEGHHIEEYQDGGSEDPSNILIVCTHCHAWINMMRTYMGHYRLKDGAA